MYTSTYYAHQSTSQHMPRFGKGTRSLRAHSPEGLSDAQLRHVAPSAFAESAHSSRSARYSYIPTSEVLTGLRREGFVPMEIRQAGSRIEGKAEFTKHMIRLRHQGEVARQLAVGDSVPEIVLINSHDGTSSYQLMSGMFRLVCSNGLIVADGPSNNVKVPHTGDVQSAVIDGCIEILETMPATVETVGHFRGLSLSAGEQRAFAAAALQLRYESAEKPPIEAENLLTPQRRDDTGDSLWHTLNRVQENTIRGGQYFVTRDANGHRRRGHTREVKAIDGNVSLNKALWTLAEEMRRLKA